ncbi:hypothetical protein BDN72DRAFT_849124 [Pluteus cervinus]|uniref:Uncharacterized protein n=1 Tax=Pluteus cervinus TaxID=181527 RepID=A0ACD3A8N9_9AGAR|nr:hypothetical protein BDN72DRAFT_849124 [Pluteus cervinus]
MRQIVLPHVPLCLGLLIISVSFSRAQLLNCNVHHTTRHDDTASRSIKPTLGLCVRRGLRDWISCGRLTQRQSFGEADVDGFGWIICSVDVVLG